MTVMVLTMGVTFVACGDDKDEPEVPVVPDTPSDDTGIDSAVTGKWMRHEYEEGPSGSMKDVYEYTEWLTLDSSGKWTLKFEEFDYGTLYQGEASGTFTAKNGRMTLTCKKSTVEDVKPGDKLNWPYSVKGNKLTLTIDSEKIEYTKS